MYSSTQSEAERRIGGDIMADQNKKTKIQLVNNYIQERSQLVSFMLEREADSTGDFDSTYQSGLDAAIKAEETKLFKMGRWLLDNLGITPPAAFTDAEVDAINPKIRTAV